MFSIFLLEGIKKEEILGKFQFEKEKCGDTNMVEITHGGCKLPYFFVTVYITKIHVS